MTRSPQIELHPEAVAEARHAYHWYRERSEQAGDLFVEALDRALDAIGEAPTRPPEYLHGTRRYLLRRFPYFVVYRHVDDRILIVAVAHGRRRPGYWKGRTSPK